VRSGRRSGCRGRTGALTREDCLAPVLQPQHRTVPETGHTATLLPENPVTLSGPATPGLQAADRVFLGAAPRRRWRGLRPTGSTATVVVAAPSGGELGSIPDTGLYVALLVLIAWLPIPWGSNRPWSWALMEAATFGLLAVWLAKAFTHPAQAAETVSIAMLPLLLFSLWLAYILAQTLPLPDGLLALLSPVSYEHHRQAAFDPATAYRSLSLDPSATLADLGKDLAYVALFFLTIALARTRRRLVVLVSALLFVGVAESVFGVYVMRSHFKFVPEGLRDGHWDVVTGTFINRNHFAAHLAMIIPLGVGLLLGGTEDRSFLRGWRRRLNGLILFITGWRGLVLLALATMGAALLLSKSRGGNLALLVGLVTVMGLAALFRGLKTREVRLLSATLLLALSLAAALDFGGLGERMARIAIESSGRATQWELTLHMFEDYWAFGSGAGSYKSVFINYKDDRLPPVVHDHAHNDYLELLSEQGIVGSALLSVAVCAIIGRAVYAYKVGQDRSMRGLLLGSLAGITAMLFHALVDFNFHIPANAAYFYVLLGIGMSASMIRAY
jgi:putative inorganic carbon (HCO3(-)) transporter